MLSLGEKILFGRIGRRQGDATIGTEKIFENILFVEEVFGNHADQDILKTLVLEMAQCFELSHQRREERVRSSYSYREWCLWN